MTIDEVLSDFSIHLHLSKESEHEILAEIRAHLEDSVAAAVIQGEDEHLALQKVAAEFGIEEAGRQIQHIHASWESLDAIFITALPVLFALVLRWLTFAPDGSTRNWQQLLNQPEFLVVAFSAFLLPLFFLRRRSFALMGWGVFWFLTVIFTIFPAVRHW
jgi:hypothetical protein